MRLLLTLILLTAPASAATVGVGNARATVADSAARPFQCVLDALTARGYPVRFVGGWRAHGSVRGSLHPRGLAMDVNQTGRGRTVPRMPPDEVELARACGVVSGASWRNGDSGHFQIGGYEGTRERAHGAVAAVPAGPPQWDLFALFRNDEAVPRHTSRRRLHRR